MFIGVFFIYFLTLLNCYYSTGCTATVSKTSKCSNALTKKHKNRSFRKIKQFFGCTGKSHAPSVAVVSEWSAYISASVEKFVPKESNDENSITTSSFESERVDSTFISLSRQELPTTEELSNAFKDSSNNQSLNLQNHDQIQEQPETSVITDESLQLIQILISEKIHIMEAMRMIESGKSNNCYAITLSNLHLPKIKKSLKRLFENNQYKIVMLSFHKLEFSSFSHRFSKKLSFINTEHIVISNSSIALSTLRILCNTFVKSTKLTLNSIEIIDDTIKLQANKCNSNYHVSRPKLYYNNVTELTVKSCKVQYGFLKLILSFNRLKKLFLHENSLGRSFLKLVEKYFIENNNQIQEIKLGPQTKQDPVNFRLHSMISRVEGLVALSIESDSSMANLLLSDFSSLKFFKNLTYLSLSSNPNLVIDDKLLSFLFENLHFLNTIIVKGCNIQVEELKKYEQILIREKINYESNTGVSPQIYGLLKGDSLTIDTQSKEFNDLVSYVRTEYNSSLILIGNIYSLTIKTDLNLNHLFDASELIFHLVKLKNLHLDISECNYTQVDEGKIMRLPIHNNVEVVKFSRCFVSIKDISNPTDIGKFFSKFLLLFPKLKALEFDSSIFFSILFSSNVDLKQLKMITFSFVDTSFGDILIALEYIVINYENTHTEIDLIDACSNPEKETLEYNETNQTPYPVSKHEEIIHHIWDNKEEQIFKKVNQNFEFLKVVMPLLNFIKKNYPTVKELNNIKLKKVDLILNFAADLKGVV